jgi:hypothetical protein
VTFGRFTNRCTYSITFGIITFPWTFRMTF